MRSSINNRKRVFVLGIDGLPYTFVRKQFEAGRMPHFNKLSANGDMKQMSTVLPPVSSVAWTSFMTGRNPAAHNIFGFVDRDPETMQIVIPTRRNLRAPTISEILSDHGKRVIQMNVPCSYPPTPVNGILVSCFLATELSKATYPPEFAATLERLGYVIDVDPWKAREDRNAFLDDVFHALDRRLAATLHLLDSEDWDFFISHIMETDRISHFFWEDMETGAPVYADRFLEFFDKVDQFIATIAERVLQDSELIIASDHGFCTLKKEVFINNALADAGFLKFNSGSPQQPFDIHPSSKAYSLIPGRFFVNLRERECTGTVSPGAECERVISDLSDFLLSLKDPDEDSEIISRIYRKEEIYSGPYMDSAPDLIAVPADGYDLKGALKSDSLFSKGAIVGTHTHWDATLFVNGRSIASNCPTITDVMPSILSMFDIHGVPTDGNVIF